MPKKVSEPMETPEPATPINDEPEQILEKPKADWKKRAAFGVVILAAIIVGGYYAYTQFKTPADTSQSTQPKQQADTLQGTLAFLRDGDVWVSSNGKLTKITKDGSKDDVWYNGPVLSPDGNSVAFIRQPTEGDSKLFVSDLKGSTKELVTFEYGLFEPLWSKDSKSLYFVDGNGRIRNPSDSGFDIFSIPVGGGKKTKLGSFWFGTGCGGGSSDPADGAASDEDLIYHSPFALSPDGKSIYHSLSCVASGIGRLDIATGIEKEISEARMLDVSSSGDVLALDDGDTLIVISGNSKKTFDAAKDTRNAKWSKDGKFIYYTSYKSIGEIKFPIGGEEQVVADRSRISVNRLEVATGKTTAIKEYEAKGIRIAGFTASGNLLLAVVEDSDEYFDYLRKNKMFDGDIFTPKTAEGKALLPTTNIFELNLNNNSSKQVLNDARSLHFLP